MKRGIIRVMKSLATAVLLPTAAFGVAVGPLPPSEYANTEVATNIPFAVSLETMSRVEFSLSLDASPTNCVEVAVGTDADGDGDLSLEEADWTVGFRCGAWFVRDAAGDAETETAEPRTGRLERLFALKRRNLDPAWNLVKVTRRCVAEIGEIVLAEGKRPGAALFVR